MKAELTRRHGSEVRRALALWQQLGRNPLAITALVYLGVLVVVSVAEPWLISQSPTRIDLLNQFAAPSVQHPLGTDENGRDVLARLVSGSRISLAVGFTAAAIAISVGTIVGAVAGYFGGRLDNALMRLTDGLMSIPIFFLLLAVVSVYGSTALNVILALGVTRWMPVARLVRGEILRYRAMEFVQAARATGATDRRIIVAHLIPQTVPSVIVAATLGIAQAILAESGLSYLGLGVQPPTPTWGNMLSYSQDYVWSAPQLAVYPGLMILLAVLAFNALGDGLRDALDPNLRRRA